MDILFESMYEDSGRYSVLPEWLLRGLVLQTLYGIRSERLLCEQPGYAISQVTRKLIETWFGDGKQHGGTIRQVKLRGLPKVTDGFTLAMLTVNLRRLPKLFARQAGLAGTG